MIRLRNKKLMGEGRDDGAVGKAIFGFMFCQEFS
jgi:hypothetical protein